MGLIQTKILTQMCPFKFLGFLSRIQLCREYALCEGYFWPKFGDGGHWNILMDRVYPSWHVNLLLIVEIKSCNLPKFPKVCFQIINKIHIFSSKFGVSNTKYESTGGGRMNKWPWPAQTLKTSFAAGGQFRRENKARILMASQKQDLLYNRSRSF